MSASKKVVSGFVVREETRTEDQTTHVVLKTRLDVSRVFHSRAAAEDMMKLLQKSKPSGDFYITEKTKRDDGGQIV